jgi:hypothetical protein
MSQRHIGAGRSSGRPERHRVMTPTDRCDAQSKSARASHQCKSPTRSTVTPETRDDVGKCPSSAAERHGSNTRGAGRLALQNE